MSRVPVVAVFNSNDDVVEMLRIAIEQRGMVVVSGHVGELRRGGQALSDFLAEHDPGVILYDLVPPYDRSWLFLEHLRESPSMRGRKFVVTSTNAARAREVIGTAEHVHEVIGKPFDLDAVVDAVERAFRAAEQPDARRV
jgi:CheY-like chemotaxis protein